MLTEADLRPWRSGLPETLKDTAKQRLATDLKPALNRTIVANRTRLDQMMPSVVKYGLQAPANDDDETQSLSRKNKILSDSQVIGLLHAAQQVDASSKWNGESFQTRRCPCRYGSSVLVDRTYARMGLPAQASRLLVPVSRKGRGQKSGSIPIPIGRDVLDVLLPAVTGREKDEPLLARSRYKQWQAASGGSQLIEGRGGQLASSLGRGLTSVILPHCLKQSLMCFDTPALFGASRQVGKRFRAILKGSMQMPLRTVRSIIQDGYWLASNSLSQAFAAAAPPRASQPNLRVAPTKAHWRPHSAGPCMFCPKLHRAEDPSLQSVEKQMDYLRRMESQYLAEEKSADDGVVKRLPQF